MIVNVGTLAELCGPGNWSDAVYVEVWQGGEITDFRPFIDREAAEKYAKTLAK